MKKILTVTAVMVLFIFIGQVYAQTQTQMAGLPTSNALVKSGGWSEDVAVKVDKAGVATVTVPIASAQSGTPVLYRSYARVSGNTWAQITDGKYQLSTRASAGLATADLALGKGIFRVRMWGKINSDWMFINQSSEYCRTDVKKDVAYEFIVNTETGKVMSVPNDYPAWD